MNEGCIKCFYKQAKKLFDKHDIDYEIADDILRRMGGFIEKYKNADLSAPEIAVFLHRLVRKAAKTDDLYKFEKQYYNELLLELEPEIRNNISRSEDVFQSSLKYAVAGNIIDFGPPKSFDIHETLSQALTKVPAIDHSAMLKEALYKANTVLYLGDNAGEIVLDKIFIQTIGHSNLFFAVRGGKVMNDVTMEDAEFVGMTQVAKVISNGYDAPSTLLSRCSSEFMELYAKADIIISKGQGNLEGLMNIKNKRIFFLLMVKCQVMAEITDVQEGDIIIMENSRLRNQDDLNKLAL